MRKPAPNTRPSSKPGVHAMDRYVYAQRTYASLAARQFGKAEQCLRELGSAGVEFGSHGLTHADLTRLAPGEREREIRQSAEDLAERTGRSTRCFAAPYGHVNRVVLGDMAKHYEAAFGTRFNRARPNCDRFNVPRIEMHYFRNPRRWRAFVTGDDGYFLARRVLRAGRIAGMKLLGMGAEIG